MNNYCKDVLNLSSSLTLFLSEFNTTYQLVTTSEYSSNPLTSNSWTHLSNNSGCTFGLNDVPSHNNQFPWLEFLAEILKSPTSGIADNSIIGEAVNDTVCSAEKVGEPVGEMIGAVVGAAVIGDVVGVGDGAWVESKVVILVETVFAVCVAEVVEHLQDDDVVDNKYLTRVPINS